jgi:hypothetical protein
LKAANPSIFTELFEQALHISSPWFIKSIDFNADKKRLDIHVDFKRGSTFADPDSSGETEKMYHKDIIWTEANLSSLR